MARKRRQGSQQEETSWGHLGCMHGELGMVATGRSVSWEGMELHGGCTFDHREIQKHPPTLPGVTPSPLRPGFIISQGQGS